MIKPTRPDKPDPTRPATTIAQSPSVQLFGGWGPRL